MDAERIRERIYLVGYMGSGKTTIGRLLAKQRGLQFIDLDIYIEGRYHKRISDLFAERGEEGFRAIERALLGEVSEVDDVVVAVGGGTPCFFDNMERMNQTGLTVYLHTDPKLLLPTLKTGKSKRPLIADKTDDELEDYIREQLAQRDPYYTQAHETVESDGTVETLLRETAEAVERGLKKRQP